MRITHALIAASVGLGGVLAGSSAYATAWYSQSSPLKAYEDGYVQAAAYGNFYNENHTYARSNSVQKDARPGGNSVYVDTDFAFWGPGVDGVNIFKPWSSKETTRTNTSSWISDYTREQLRPTSDRARGTMHVCEDQSFSGDPCSADALVTFSY